MQGLEELLSWLPEHAWSFQTDIVLRLYWKICPPNWYVPYLLQWHLWEAWRPFCWMNFHPLCQVLASVRCCSGWSVSSYQPAPKLFSSNVFCHVVRRGILDFLCLMHWLPCKWPIWRKEKRMFHIVYKQQLLKNNDLTNGFMACLHDLVLQAQQLCDMFVLFLIFLNYLGLKQ